MTSFGLYFKGRGKDEQTVMLLPHNSTMTTILFQPEASFDSRVWNFHFHFDYHEAANKMLMYIPGLATSAFFLTFLSLCFFFKKKQKQTN